jgi:hypothetical protein
MSTRGVSPPQTGFFLLRKVGLDSAEWSDASSSAAEGDSAEWFVVSRFDSAEWFVAARSAESCELDARFVEANVDEAEGRSAGRTGTLRASRRASCRAR